MNKLGCDHSASTLNTDNSALNRVFNEAVARGYMSQTHVPMLVNKSKGSKRRRDFRLEEYKKLTGHLARWINAGRAGKSRYMRHPLRDYILVLAKTQVSGTGAEAANLRWKHIHQFEEKGLKFFEMHVSGKTSPRDLICRAGVIIYPKRIQSRSPDIDHLSFEDLLKAQLGVSVFRLPDGTVTKHLHSWMVLTPVKRLQAIRLLQHRHNPMPNTPIAAELAFNVFDSAFSLPLPS